MMKKGIVAVLMIFFFILSPLKAFAHDAFFFQVVVDTNSFIYSGNVVTDSASMFNSESKHIEAELGDFSMLKSKASHFTLPTADTNNCGSYCYSASEKVTDGLSTMPFTFAPLEDGGGWFSKKSKNNATKADVDQAYLIKETLMPSLNDALKIVNDGEKFKTIGDFLKISNQLSTGGIINGWNVQYPADNAPKTNLNTKTGTNDSDYVTISKDAVSYKFVYRFVKGYKEPGDPLYSADRTTLKDDVKYMSWSDMMYQAQYAYVIKGITAKEAYQMSKPSSLEVWIVNLFENTFNGIRNLLGLYSMNELIYNDGIRGSSAYHYGAMPSSWATNVNIFHWIFQALAWSLIALALMKALILKNLSSINPNLRVSLIESIQDMLLTGLILAIALPLINMFLMFNVKIVNIFGATAPDISDLSGLNNYSNGLAGVILQFFYLVIGFYLNFTYIIRAITIAVLVAMAPLFIVTLAFGGHWKSLFGLWMKELLSNIFLQSFHAFAFAFFITIGTTSRGIESMVIAFAIIPLTEFFRSMIMGKSGAIAGAIGMNAIKAGAGMIGGVASAGKSVGQKRTDSGDGKANKDGNTKDKKDSATSTTANDKTMAGSSDKLSNKSSNNSSNGGAMGANEESLESKMNKEMPIDLARSTSGGMEKVTQHRGTDANADNNKLGERSSEARKSDEQARKGSRFDRVMNGLEATASGVATGSKVALGGAMAAGKVGLGAGMILALGGLDSGIAQSGSKMIGSGARTINGSLQKVGSTVTSKGAEYAKDGYESMKDKARDMFTTKPVPNTFSKDKQGAFIEGEMLARTKPNGDIEVHRNGEMLQHNGLMRANDDADGNAVFTYDMNNENMAKEDKANVNSYVNAYRDPKNNADQIAHLKQQGIERVSANAHGNIMVAYNKTGKEKLGIKTVQTMGDGRVVETKRSQDPMATRMTLPIQKMPEKQSTPTGNGQNNQKNGQGNQQKGGNSNGNNRNAGTVGGQRTSGGRTN
jgi:hypothetical protein